jgi:hypothetical protein
VCSSDLEAGIKAIRAKYGAETKVVFVFDSLEKIQGDRVNEGAVIDSVRRVFSQGIEWLQLPYVHAVYTVPPWLDLVEPSLVDSIRVLPAVRQWKNTPDRENDPEGWNLLRALLQKRIGPRMESVFGAPDAAGHFEQAEKLIAICGGHFRDLLQLVRNAIQKSSKLPLTDRAVQATINAANKFIIADDDAEWLSKIGQYRSAYLDSYGDTKVMRLSRFLDRHWVLFLTNGEGWYDLHPLVRAEVEGIMQRRSQQQQQQPSSDKT